MKEGENNLGDKILPHSYTGQFFDVKDRKEHRYLVVTLYLITDSEYSSENVSLVYRSYTGTVGNGGVGRRTKDEPHV